MPVMPLALAMLAACAAPASAAVYRGLDADGHVVYSDRPQAPGQAPLRLGPPNVMDPEARRQLELEKSASLRAEQEEREARLRRWLAVQATPEPPRGGGLSGPGFSWISGYGVPAYYPPSYRPYYNPGIQSYGSPRREAPAPLRAQHGGRWRGR